MSKEVKKTAPRTEVIVKKDGHTHGGKVCKAGDPIKVTKRQKEWLEKIEVI